jgi:hypothetical protein
MPTTRYFTAVVCLAVLAAHCLSPLALSAEELVPIKGMITLDGKPIPSGRVFFFVGDQFVGCKIKDGRFTVDRVAIGMYAVTIESKGVPARYSSEDTTGLRVQVRTGANVFNFDLTST